MTMTTEMTVQQIDALDTEAAARHEAETHLAAAALEKAALIVLFDIVEVSEIYRHGQITTELDGAMLKLRNDPSSCAPHCVLSAMTYEGVAAVALPCDMTQESLDLLIEVLQLQRETFPAKLPAS